MVSPVATGFMWQLLFNPTIGLVNPVLRDIGLGGVDLAWLADTRTALWIVILAMAWQWNGLAVVLFLAGLQKVPPDLQDAAEVDGAKPLRVFRDVTFPHLTPVYGTATALLVIYAFRAFDLPYVIGGPVGAPDQATLLMGTSIYGSAYGTGALSAGYNRMGYALAQGVILLVGMAIVASLILAFFGRRQRRVYG
jgi:raffinose/stachyose/melibiose transport system permease protein